MATDKQTVDIIIKANNLSGKTLREVSTAVDKLSDAVANQVAAAKKGEIGLNQLTQSYKELADSGKQLLAQENLVNLFKSVAASVGQAEVKVNAARAAYVALAEEQSYQSTVTKKQDNELKALAKSVGVAEKALAREQSTLAKISADMEAAGISTNKLADAQNLLVGSAEKIAASQNALTESIADYELHLRAANAEQKKLAETKAFEAQLRQAEELRRAASYVRFWTEALEKADLEQKQIAASAERAAAEIASAQKILQRTRAAEEAALAAFNAQSAQNAQLMRDAEYVRFWTEALDRAEHEQRELADETKRTTDAIRAQEKAKRDADERARNIGNPFDSNGRTTLSLLQRIRGELLAITAAYVGFQGIVEGIRSILESAKTGQQIGARLLLLNNSDITQAGEELQYLREQAERLGIYLPDLAKQYSSFAIAAKAANMNTSELRFTFERVAEAGKVLGLSGDQLNGTFLAITQMVSKGKIQLEELTGQLAERIPGAIQYLGNQYQGGTAELLKQIEKGNVEATNGVLNLARGLDEAFNEQLANSTQGIESNEARFKTAVYELQKTIAESGVTQAYNQLLVKLTEFLRSDEAVTYAKDLANALIILADAIKFVVDNLETFKILMTGLLAVFAARLFFKLSVDAALFARSILTTSTALATAAPNASAFATAVTRIQAAFILLQTAIAGFTLGSWLQETFEEVRQFGVILVVGFDEMWILIKYGAQMAFESIVEAWKNNGANLINNVGSTFRTILKIMESGARAVGADSIANSIAKALDKITISQTNAAEDRIKALKVKMMAELKSANEIGKQMLKDATDASRAAFAEADKKRQELAQGGRTEDPGGNAAAFTVGDEAAKALVEKYKSLLAEVEAVESQSLKKQKDSIESITAGIELQYQALIRKINESGVKGAAELQARLRAAVDVLKSEAVEKYNEQQLAKVEAIQTKFAELESKIGRGKDSTLDDRFAAIDSKYKSLYADISELDAERKGNLKETLDLLIQQTKAVEEQKFAQDSINASQREMNNLVAARDDRIKTTNALVEAGIITEQEGRQRIKEIIEQSQPGIEMYAQAARDVLDSFRGLVDDSVIEKAAANIDLATASANRFKVELYTANEANRDLAAGLTSATSEAAKGFGEAIVGAQTLGDAIKGAGRAFLDFAADFLLKIAEMILQQVILNALQGATGGGAGGFLSGFVNAAVNHDGGTVGSTDRSRVVTASMFANAPKYHSGGIAGLAPDEYPSILRKNEEVLKSDSPRNILNMGKESSTAAAPIPQDIKVINTIDSGSFVSEGLTTPQGQKAVFNFIRANKASVKQLLG